MWWLGTLGTILIGVGLVGWLTQRKGMQNALIARCLVCDGELAAHNFCPACERSDREIQESAAYPKMIALDTAIDALTKLRKQSTDPWASESDLRALEQQAVEALRSHPEWLALIPDLEVYPKSNLIRWSSSSPESFSASIQKLKDERKACAETVKTG